jgi:hypothetical protein
MKPSMPSTDWLTVSALPGLVLNRNPTCSAALIDRPALIAKLIGPVRLVPPAPSLNVTTDAADVTNVIASTTMLLPATAVIPVWSPVPVGERACVRDAVLGRHRLLRVRRLSREAGTGDHDGRKPRAGALSIVTVRAAPVLT